MDLYDQTAQAAAELLTKRYSTSFSLSARLFPPVIRCHIYNIYGLVRIADEIVDTYTGNDRQKHLDDLEQEVSRAISTGYSSNLIVHAFQITARSRVIDRPLIEPFFASMRMDCQPVRYNKALYRRYVYGSAEVVGLMCLKTFVEDAVYDELQLGASRLGAAFQKVNFLRDMAEDYQLRQRYYFPQGSFDSFDDAVKAAIIADIRDDFQAAEAAIYRLPDSARPAVLTAYDYFTLLLAKLEATPAEDIKHRRVRIPDSTKVWLLARRMASQQLRKGPGRVRP